MSSGNYQWHGGESHCKEHNEYYGHYCTTCMSEEREMDVDSRYSDLTQKYHKLDAENAQLKDSLIAIKTACTDEIARLRAEVEMAQT